jgi:hypothetical protein
VIGEDATPGAPEVLQLMTVIAVEARRIATAVLATRDLMRMAALLH